MSIDPFDPILARSRTAVVALNRVVDPLSMVQHDPYRVAAYRAEMREGARFPPISVVTWGSRYLVADGHKRLAAYRALDRPEICVEVWTWRRWRKDQCRQAAENARKNARILRLSVTDPRAALRLFGTTLDHWRRVARSLMSWVTGEARRRERERKQEF